MYHADFRLRGGESEDAILISLTLPLEKQDPHKAGCHKAS